MPWSPKLVFTYYLMKRQMQLNQRMSSHKQRLLKINETQTYAYNIHVIILRFRVFRILCVPAAHHVVFGYLGFCQTCLCIRQELVFDRAVCLTRFSVTQASQKCSEWLGLGCVALVRRQQNL